MNNIWHISPYLLAERTDELIRRTHSALCGVNVRFFDAVGTNVASCTSLDNTPFINHESTIICKKCLESKDIPLIKLRMTAL